MARCGGDCTLSERWEADLRAFSSLTDAAVWTLAGCAAKKMIRELGNARWQGAGCYIFKLVAASRAWARLRVRDILDTSAVRASLTAAALAALTTIRSFRRDEDLLSCAADALDSLLGVGVSRSRDMAVDFATTFLSYPESGSLEALVRAARAFPSNVFLQGRIFAVLLHIRATLLLPATFPAGTWEGAAVPRLLAAGLPAAVVASLRALLGRGGVLGGDGSAGRRGSPSPAVLQAAAVVHKQLQVLFGAGSTQEFLAGFCEAVQASPDAVVALVRGVCGEMPSWARGAGSSASPETKLLEMSADNMRIACGNALMALLFVDDDRCRAAELCTVFWATGGHCAVAATLERFLAVAAAAVAAADGDTVCLSLNTLACLARLTAANATRLMALARAGEHSAAGRLLNAPQYFTTTSHVAMSGLALCSKTLGQDGRGSGCAHLSQDPQDVQLLHCVWDYAGETLIALLSCASESARLRFARSPDGDAAFEAAARFARWQPRRPQHLPQTLNRGLTLAKLLIVQPPMCGADVRRAEAAVTQGLVSHACEVSDPHQNLSFTVESGIRLTNMLSQLSRFLLRCSCRILGTSPREQVSFSGQKSLVS